MKKMCIIVCSLLVVAALALDIAPLTATKENHKEITICDLDYDYVSY